FDREVVHALAMLAFGSLLGLQPAVDHAVADSKNGGQIPIIGAGVRWRLAARISQLVKNSLAQLRCVRMKRRQREHLRSLWHFPTGIGVARAEKIQLTFGTQITSRAFIRKHAPCQISWPDKVPQLGRQYCGFST